MSRLDFLRMEARQELEKLLQDVLEALENMPCGVSDVDAYNLEDVCAAEEKGQVIENDAMFHQTQKTWLFLNKAIEKLEEI